MSEYIQISKKVISNVIYIIFQGNQHTQKMKEAHARAAELILQRKLVLNNCITGLFWTPSNVYDGAFLLRQLTAFSRSLFSQGSSIIHV